MKRLFNLLTKVIILLFWLGVLAALAKLLPGKLNGFLPPCGLIVLLMHWAQASMIRKACERYFAVTRAEYWQIILFGVFATQGIRDRLNAIITPKE